MLRDLLTTDLTRRDTAVEQLFAEAEPGKPLHCVSLAFRGITEEDQSFPLSVELFQALHRAGQGIIAV